MRKLSPTMTDQVGATSEVCMTSPYKAEPRSMKLRPPKWNWPGFILMLPALVFMTLFVFIPTVYVIYLSGFKWNLLSATPKFVGLKNYVELFSSPDFRESLWNTLFFSGGMMVISLPLGLLLAVLLDQKLKGTNFYRTVLFSPYVVPLVGSGLVWTLLYNKDYGLVNRVLSLLHIAGPDWLCSAGYALPAVLMMSVWQYLGYYMLIFLSGLQSVPDAIKEAAAVDGAGRWSTFRHVTLPSLAPSIVFAMVVCLIQSFQTFDQVYVMTGGGPNNATSTLVYYIYNEGFQMFNIGKATAASVLLLVLLSVLTWLQVKMSNRWVVEE
jgi:ABC-type sugar transport system permease subunit